MKNRSAFLAFVLFCAAACSASFAPQASAQQASKDAAYLDTKLPLEKRLDS